MRFCGNKKGKSLSSDPPFRFVLSIEYLEFFGFDIYRFVGGNTTEALKTYPSYSNADHFDKTRPGSN